MSEPDKEELVGWGFGEPADPHAAKRVLLTPTGPTHAFGLGVLNVGRGVEDKQYSSLKGWGGNASEARSELE